MFSLIRYYNELNINIVWIILGIFWICRYRGRDASLYQTSFVSLEISNFSRVTYYVFIVINNKNKIVENCS